ncbi:minor tail protein [Gordonia phage Verity]|uniref:Minor tail protein n=1 Tax=Gordonia phage Verity TaxID=2591211 RepID=A0A514DIR3_9CAUD|nr:minor tail protein [Gordonia phage Verity]QDH93511.1 minor tail protein [Gordonia phage Verity]QPO16868.1 minor tail protein [Gordonia phage Delrey21]QXN74151.1 minor tail protein [Gordonia phage DoctorFroggo]
MAYTRPTIVSGVTRATKAFFDNLLDGIDEKLAKADADTEYARAGVATLGVAPQFDIDATGVSDSAAGVRAALAATPEGGTLLLPGTIRLSSGVAVTNRSVTIQVEGTVNSDAGVAPFTFSASPETIYPVSALVATTITNETGVTQAALSLTLASTPPWKRGDAVKLFADDEVPGARLGDGVIESRFGQYHVVQSVSGTTVVLIGSLRDPCTMNVRVTRMPRHAVALTGSGVFGQIGIPITFRHLRAPQIKARILGSGGQGILLQGCYQPRAQVSIDDAPDNGTVVGYGLIDNSGANGVFDIHASRVRHAYTDDTPRIAAGSTEVWKYGRSFAHRVAGSAAGTSNTAWDTHAASEGVHFDCIAVDCIGIVGLRGRNHTGRFKGWRPAKSSWKFFSEPNRGTWSHGHDIEIDVYDPPAGYPVGSVILNDGTGFATAGVRETRPSRAQVRVHGQSVPPVIVEAVNATLVHEVSLVTPGRLAPAETLTNSELRSGTPQKIIATPYTSDGFTGANGNIATGRNTDLEQGGTVVVPWEISPTSRFAIQTNQLTNGTVDGLGLMVLPVPSNNVRLTARVRSTATAPGISQFEVRRKTATYVADPGDSAYAVRVGAGQVRLIKKVAGSGIWVDVSDPFTHDADVDVAVQVFDSLLSLLINGAEIMSITDTSITAGGYVGVYKTGAGSMGPINWVRVDLLTAG